MSTAFWFDQPRAVRVTERNVARLSRSARKWRRAGTLDLADTDMGWLAATAHHLAAQRGAPTGAPQPPPAAPV